MKQNNVKTFITAKNIVRTICVLCLVFVFCPSFLVSCSGKDVGVSAMKTAAGIKYHGETVSDPVLVLFLCLLIPIVVFAIFFVKKITEKILSAVILGCSILDIIINIGFYNGVKSFAEENYCDFKVLAWFVINIILLILMAIMALLVLLKVMSWETNIIEFFAGDAKNQAFQQMAHSVKKMSTSVYAMTGKISNSEQSETTTEIDLQVKPVSDGKIGVSLKKIPMTVWAGIVGVAVVLIVLICVIVQNSNTINLNKYIVEEATGYNGYGTANVTIDFDAINEKYGKKMKFSKSYLKENSYIDTWFAPIDFLEEYISISVENEDHLSNGDEVTYTWNIDNKLKNALNLKFKYKDSSYKVSDLEDISTFDAFADLQVTFEGTAPNGYMEYSYTGEDALDYYFECDNRTELSNGDKVKIFIDEDMLEDFVERYGKVPETLEKEYTVSGLDEYITSYENLPDEFIDLVKSEAEDSIYSYAATSYSSDYALSDVTYAGYILGWAKPDSYAGNYNNLYLIYSGVLSSADGDFPETTVFFPIRYENILKTVDGVNYSTKDGIVGSSTIGSYWYSTRGYTNAVKCYADIVNANSENYDFTSGDGFEKYSEFSILSSLAEISDENREELKTKSENVISQYIENRYSSDVTTSDMTYVGEYLLYAKEDMGDIEYMNRLIVVESVLVTNTNGKFEPTTVYFPVSYEGVVRMDDGSCAYLGDVSILGESYFENSYYWTKGYIDGSQMYSKLISANRESYKYEVSESLKGFGN